MVPEWMISNFVVALLLAVAIAMGIWVARNRLWREACGQLWRRRPWALLVVAFYIAVAAADSIYWVGTDIESSDVVARHQALSLVDRLFLGTEEASYSAPFSDVEFYGGAALSRPGTHPLGTIIGVMMTGIMNFHVSQRVTGATLTLALWSGAVAALALAMALLIKPFPPASRPCPPAKRQIRTPSTISSWPTTAF